MQKATSKTAKDKRFKLYKEQKVQLLISKFMGGELSELNPVYDPKSGYRYPVVDTIAGDLSTEKFLESLFDAGVLKKELYDKIIYCPFCNTVNVSIHYCCPYCKSFNIKKSALVEHVQCGYIDAEERFRKNSKLVCPRCCIELTKPDVDYHKAGVWCTCNECRKSFDIPVPIHFCRECRRNFTFEEANYKDVHSYGLTPKASKEAKLSWILIAPIKEFLESRGFKVESPGFLKGKSGASHLFDITAYPIGTGQNTTVIDIAASANDVLSEQPVISLFAKIYDVSPVRACLITNRKMSENGKRLASLYKIEIIEAKNQNEAINELKDFCGGIG